jgi:hypothetical protein
VNAAILGPLVVVLALVVAGVGSVVVVVEVMVAMVVVVVVHQAVHQITALAFGLALVWVALLAIYLGDVVDTLPPHTALVGAQLPRTVAAFAAGSCQYVTHDDTCLDQLTEFHLMQQWIVNNVSWWQRWWWWWNAQQRRFDLFGYQL